MATIHVDGSTYQVAQGQNLLEACLQLGFDLPYFCWHPAMGSVGACRQCAIRQFKDADDTQGSLVMACMSPADDGTRISVHDAEARDFRASVIEWLMVNHPHDCPVCAEGGECHLQDMTVMTGHTYRRFRFDKRTHRNQYLGPFIAHEMNRCIACYRCTRFYREYAGGEDLEAFGMHDHVYFGRHGDGALENEFSGNLVEVCPTGVFTDKPLTETYTRKWDLRATPSICVHCGVGCNTSPGERYGKLKRVQNRYNSAVNGYFLCDRGRFGFDFVNHPRRLRSPRLQAGGGSQALSRRTAVRQLSDLLARPETIAIGSPRASLESNHALREAVGPGRFHNGLSALDARLMALIAGIHGQGGTRSPSLGDMERADAVLVLGEDLTNTAPRIALSLRQTARNRARKSAAALDVPAWHDAAVRNVARYARTPFYLLAPHATRLDDAATHLERRSVPELARLGAAVAHALDADAPAVEGLDETAQPLAEEIAQTLRRAERPLIVTGCGAASEALIQAATNIARALARPDQPTDLCLCVPEANSLGVALMGNNAGDVEAALTRLERGEARNVVIVENDLYERAPRERVDAALVKARHVVVMDTLPEGSTGWADLLLPTASFAESDGTLVSYEGRAQRHFKVMQPDEGVAASWRWIGDALAPDWFDATLDSLTRHCAATHPRLAAITDAAPEADYRIAGEKLARAPARYSGRTAMDAHSHVAESAPPADPESPLTLTMEGHGPHPDQPGSVTPFFRAPGWNSNQAVNKFQAEINGPLAGGDAGIRLLAPPDESQPGYFAEVPPPFTPADERYLATPRYHIFGSEPLSRLSEPVAERIPEPHLSLNPADATEMALDEGDLVALELAGDTFRLPVQVDSTLARRTLGIPLGLPGAPPAIFDGWARIRREETP